MATKEELRTSLLARPDILSIDPVSKWTVVGRVDEGGANEIVTYDVLYMPADERRNRTGQVLVQNDGKPEEHAETKIDPDEASAPSFRDTCVDYLNGLTKGTEQGNLYGAHLVETYEETRLAKAHYLRVQSDGKNLVEVWDLTFNAAAYQAGQRSASQLIIEKQRQEPAA